MSQVLVDQRSVPESLAALEDAIRHHHKACIGAATNMLAHAIQAGEALLAVRDKRMRDGSWTEWINGPRLPLGRQQAYAYMRLAKYQESLPDDNLSIAKAEAFLVGLPSLSGGRTSPRLPDPVKEDAARLRRQGLSYAEIGARFGVTKSTVHYWLNGSQDAKRAKAALTALREKEASSRAKVIAGRVGGALAEAYALSEWLDGILGQVRSEVSQPESRQEVARAHEYQRAMRDAIVRVLGAEA